MSVVHRFTAPLGRVLGLGALLLGLTVGLAACGDTATPTTAPPPATAAPSGSTTDTIAPPAGGTSIAVGLFEWGIDPKEISAPAGAVSFQVTNKGKFPHDFVVLNGTTQLAKSKNLKAGESETLTVTLPTGTVNFTDRKSVV